MTKVHRIAAIDIGTTTTRLSVADVCGPNILPVVRALRITHLGEGVGTAKLLLPSAISRVETAVSEFLDIIAQCPERPHGSGVRDVEKVVCVATSAVRDAGNADELREILACMGVELSVLSGEREAELSFLGAASSFLGDGLLVVDVGGGSTEVVLGSASQELSGPFKTSISKAYSFDMGARRMTESFLHKDPPQAADLQRLYDWVIEKTDDYMASLPMQPKRMLAVAGTATTIVSVLHKMKNYDPNTVHGTVVTGEILVSLVTQLAALPLEQRKQVVGLEPERAGVIIAGLVILCAVLAQSGLRSFTVSEADILQGILLTAGQELDS